MLLMNYFDDDERLAATKRTLFLSRKSSLNNVRRPNKQWSHGNLSAPRSEFSTAQREIKGWKFWNGNLFIVSGNGDDTQYSARRCVFVGVMFSRVKMWEKKWKSKCFVRRKNCYIEKRGWPWVNEVLMNMFHSWNFIFVTPICMYISTCKIFSWGWCIFRNFRMKNIKSRIEFWFLWLHWHIKLYCRNNKQYE